MIKLRHHDERGLTETSWLRSYHSFAFADYHSHHWHHFAHLRVINQDVVAPHHGFGMHSHANMEILTIMIKGTLTHQDSLGHKQKLPAGEIQLMRAGSGITHSEMNEHNEAAELLQIWIYPDTENLSPSYQQMSLPNITPNEWQTIVSRDQPDTLHIHQNAELALAEITQNIQQSLKADHHYWLQIINGAFSVNGQTVVAGDGMAIQNESLLDIQCQQKGKLLLFDFWD